MLMNINEVHIKIEYLIVPKGIKFDGSGKLELKLPESCVTNGRLKHSARLL